MAIQQELSLGRAFLIQEKKQTYYLVNFTIATDHRLKIKESEN